MNEPKMFYSERIGSESLRELWSEKQKRLMWRAFWCALAHAQAICGLVTPEELADIRIHVLDVDLAAAAEIEKVTRHDLMSEVKLFASQCPVGGGKIHLGATSADVEENVDALRIRQSIILLRSQLQEFVSTYFYRIPSQSIGSFLGDIDSLSVLQSSVKGKGVKGAVGTSASYAQLLKGSNFVPRDLERMVMTDLGMEAFEVTTQVYTRKQELRIASAVSMVAISLDSMGSLLGENFSKYHSRYSYLTSLLKSCMSTLWDNSSLTLLERTLDDSANRREVLPVLFLAVDEMIILAGEYLKG